VGITAITTVERDPKTKKWTATCETCGWKVTRAKKESAVWNAEAHVAYNHTALGYE
jgi:hypothetical protein